MLVLPQIRISGGENLMALQEPRPKPSTLDTEQTYEWAEIEGKMVKITAKNSNGRKCLGCGCNCPCKCADCRPVCCPKNYKGGHIDE